MWENDTNTAGQKFRPAPPQSTPPGTGTIHGVWCWPNEDVEWEWTHTLGGSYISGYKIKPKEVRPE